MNKVVHLSSVHAPFDIRIFLKECRTLAGNGYHVTFVVPHTGDEIIEGVRIRAVPKAKRRSGRMTFTIWSVFRAALKEKADLYHFHDPELIPVGLLLKLLGKRVIYDVHEDFPRQILSKHWIHIRLRKMVARIAEITEHFSVKAFDAIVAVTPEIACRFPEEKTVLVQNYPLMNEVAGYDEQTNKNIGASVIYVGGISSIRGASEMVQAIALLPDSLRVRLVLAGRCSPSTLPSELMKLEGWAKVDFVGWQSRERIKKLLLDARAGLVLFHPAPNHINAQPNKIFEYMSAGLPLIASDFPKWRMILSTHKCGLLANPLDPQDIARKIQIMIDNPEAAEEMGANGREAVLKYYNWDVEGKRMLNLYEKLLVNEEEEKRDK